jgi:Zn-finger nucleic acid-binding protein
VNPYREAQGPDVTCPRCELGLSSRLVGDARIDECSRCHGVFVPAALMPRLLDGLDLGGEVIATFPAGTPVAHPGGPMYVKCPRCRSVMNRKLFATGAKVVVDVCRADGIWFDDAELRAVAEFAARGGMERAARLEQEEQRKRTGEHEKRRAREHDLPFFTSPANATAPRNTILEALMRFLMGG